MAVAVSGTPAAGTSSTPVSASTPFTFDYTGTAGTNKTLVVGVCAVDESEGSGTPGVTGTHNGKTLTQIGSTQIHAEGSGYSWTAMFYRTGYDDGLQTISITCDQDIKCYVIMVMELSDNDQSTPIGTPVGDTGAPTDTIDIDITGTDADGLVVMAGAVRGGDADPFTPAVGTTERLDETTGTSSSEDTAATMCTKPGDGGTVNISSVAAVSDRMSAIAVEFLPSSGVAGKARYLSLRNRVL